MPPQSDLFKKIQHKYVEKLDAYLTYDMSDEQVKAWTIALSNYSDDVLSKGWDEFICTVKPGLMPSIDDCRKVMNVIVMSNNMHEHNKYNKSIEDLPHVGEDFKIYLAEIIKGNKMVSTGQWDEGDRLTAMIEVSVRLNMKDDIQHYKTLLEQWENDTPLNEKSPI